MIDLILFLLGAIVIAALIKILDWLISED